jgi:lipopolysaccharide/colanic/teichoic acid biosynthesis glycosyltransferase
VAKRLLDIVVSVLVLLAFSPVMLTAMVLVWWEDRHSPIYRANRVARGNGNFVMMKIRSMRINADETGVNSTSAGDTRITRVGRFIRRFKLDELSQFWNVVIGDMSVVGPRPNCRVGGVDDYTPAEMHLLDVRPGITDLSSIVFSDEGAILDGAPDPDARYDRVIRPWKSRLGLLYIANASVLLDLRIIYLTAVAIVSKERALVGVQAILDHLGADVELKRIATRRDPLPVGTPPGAVLARESL